MSRICMFCGKGYMNSNMVPRGIGNRCTKRTNIRRKVNLRVKHLQINGSSLKVRLCASCLKRMKKNDREATA